jgi:hypothetical protein
VALAEVMGRHVSAGDRSPPAIDGPEHLDHREDGMPLTRPSRSSILGSSAEGRTAARMQCRTTFDALAHDAVESCQPPAT